MSKEDGGLAFPGTRREELALCAFTPGGPEGPIYGDVRFPGMTLRDYFAGQALVGMVAGGQGLQITREELGIDSYKLADAMIAARSK